MRQPGHRPTRGAARGRRLAPAPADRRRLRRAARRHGSPATRTSTCTSCWCCSTAAARRSSRPASSPRWTAARRDGARRAAADSLPVGDDACRSPADGPAAPRHARRRLARAGSRISAPAARPRTTTPSRGCTRCCCAPRASRSRGGAATLPYLRGGDHDDLAQQAADDALVAVLRKLDDFRGDSRFTTWAYKFALYEAAVKLRRRAWQERELPLEPDSWPSIASRALSPHEHARRERAARRAARRDRRRAERPPARGARRGHAQRRADRRPRRAAEHDARRALQDAARRAQEAARAAGRARASTSPGERERA